MSTDFTHGVIVGTVIASNKDQNSSPSDDEGIIVGCVIGGIIVLPCLAALLYYGCLKPISGVISSLSSSLSPPAPIQDNASQATKTTAKPEEDVDPMPRFHSDESLAVESLPV